MVKPKTNKQSQRMLMGFGAALLGTIGVTSVYIPYFAEFEPAKLRRDEFLDKGNILDPSAAAAARGGTPTVGGGGKTKAKAPGSMFKNMNKQVKKGSEYL